MHHVNVCSGQAPDHCALTLRGVTRWAVGAIAGDGHGQRSQHEGAVKRGAIKNEVTPEQKQSHNEFVFLLLFWFLFVFLFVFLFLFWFWFLYATSEQRNGSITTGCLMILEKTGEAQI